MVKKIDATNLSRDEQRAIVRSSLDDLELKIFGDLQRMMGARMVEFENDTHVISKIPAADKDAWEQ